MPRNGETKFVYYGPKDLVHDYKMCGHPRLPIHNRMFPKKFHEMVEMYTSDMTSETIKKNIRLSDEWATFMQVPERAYELVYEENMIGTKGCWISTDVGGEPFNDLTDVNAEDYYDRDGFTSENVNRDISV